MATQSISVLMIEDNLLDQKAFQRYLQQSDSTIHCTFANSLMEGIACLENQLFDVILIDYQLGDGTALDFLKLHKGFPVIVITGMGNEEIAIAAMKMGACDYLIKDVHSNYLKVIPVTLENALQRWRDNQLRKLLSHTVASLSDAVFITDIKDDVIYVNPAFTTIYGYVSEEVIGKPAHVIWQSKRDNDQSIECVMRRTSVDWTGRVFHLRKNGVPFLAQISRSAVRDQTGMVFAVVGITRDVTEQTSIEVERERLLQDIQSTLHRFQRLRMSVPINCDAVTLEDIGVYWKAVERFLEKTDSFAGNPEPDHSEAENDADGKEHP
ncbi:PAS domain S-box protein [bacterium]|nr:PAS domain S-box protein [candidate division CSSED10-310 bacterium]